MLRDELQELEYEVLSAIGVSVVDWFLPGWLL